MLIRLPLLRKTVLLIAIVWPTLSWGAQIVDDPEKDIQILGQLITGDADRFAEVIARKYPPGSRHNILIINSTGGDVYEAMRIGRLVREHDLMVLVEKHGRCYSSCVLILAGGTTRAIFGLVGIHRPYFGVVEPDADIQRIYRRMSKALRSYLVDMNVSESLADLMMSVPPENIRLLDENEIALYFPKEDPIADEIVTTMEAKKRGISNVELRKRQAAAKIVCEHHERKLEQAKTTNDMVTRMAAGTQLFFCNDAVSWGLSLPEYWERIQKANDICSKDQGTECRLALLRQ